MSEESTMVAEPIARPAKKAAEKTNQKPKRQPRYNVILWDDADHTYEYVQTMMKELFRMPIEQAYQIAKQVDLSGRAICMTTTLEHAELKRDQIHAYGSDARIPRCKGSMSASIEPIGEG
ncbi:ATP-dependent Clp protease adaptor ClpS [Candidatus Laterigemmans baculatus]|uniref:ATP-dependent Clp protease adaptor ClpS n=1 Tax=Candidatus Laterigemmans baculatus TaxID=2770505 RepID=UPI0013DBBBB6|nr:ATP-dependent Clp protease adaptor ClpS [Candidatus Laterigemmans baculatus]